MSKNSNIQHVQTLMFKDQIDNVKKLTGMKNKKDAMLEVVEAFLELRPVKENGRWIVPAFPVMNLQHGFSVSKK